MIGLFDAPDEIVAAARQARDAGFTRWDCHTPFPVHGLDKAMGLRTSPVALYALCVGAVGAGLGLLMQWWMSAVDYPIRVAGKPLFSWPSFVPITFEVFVLFSALAATVLVTRFARLWRWHSPLHDSGVMREVTGHRFGLVLLASDERYDEETARALLERAGCRDIRPLEEEPE